jgi:hypothetical protein
VLNRDFSDSLYRHLPEGGVEIITEKELRHSFPKCYAYLAKRRSQLEARKGYRSWYSYSAPRNLELHDRSQILVPLLAAQPSFAAIPESLSGRLCPMASGGFTIRLAEASRILPEYLLGLLNSSILFWVLLRVSNVFRGGWITCTKQYFGQLPIIRGTPGEQSSVVNLVQCVNWLNRPLADHPETSSTRDPLMVAYWEQVLNGLVYELYFPEELHAAGLRLFDLVEQAFLPAIPPKDSDRNVCATFLKTLRTKFEEVHDASHPLKVALQKLQTLDTVRIIEGKA